MGKFRAGGIIKNINLAKIGVLCVPDRPGVASMVFGALCESGINVQFIVQLIDPNNKSHIILCVDNSDIETALLAIERVRSEVQAEEVVCQPDVAMISVFGPHFRDCPGVASTVFSALASVGINIIAISTSISTVSCVIDGDCVAKAVESLRNAFSVPASAVFTASSGVSLHSRTGEGFDD